MPLYFSEMQEINTQVAVVEPNLDDYGAYVRNFTWKYGARDLTGLPDGEGTNIAHEAVVRHAGGVLKDNVALRWIRRDRSAKDFTYAELNALASRFANVLTLLDVAKGDTVSTLTGRIPELYVAALGTFKTVAVFCPLHSMFGPGAVFERLRHSEAKVLVTTLDLFEKKIKSRRGQLSALKYVLLVDKDNHLDERVLSLPLLMRNASPSFAIPPTRNSDPALLHFTSGTTGMPKAVLHGHGAVLTHLVTGRLVLDFHPGDVYWCTADPAWATGTSYGIIAPLVNGVTNLFDEGEFDAARWYSILAEQKVNVWYTGPAAIRRLMRLPIKPRKQYDLEPLRLISSTGEPLPAGAVRWATETFGVPVIDSWWQTETGGIMISNYRNMPVKAGSMGKPLPGVRAAIAEITDGTFRIIQETGKDGHLVLKRGWPSMFKTYVGGDDRYVKTFHDDWYITGDLAYRDPDGYYWFVGRSEDVIKTSGHRVGPFEVESALLEHASVAEPAVIGKPKPAIGEIIKAFVVLKPGSAASENLKLDIAACVGSQLGPAVAPKEIAFVDSLPKTRTGKIMRRLLKARELELPEGDLSTLEPA
ncbi:MAG TPA: acetate--CoA ligase [Chryseosolibacter sp.]